MAIAWASGGPAVTVAAAGAGAAGASAGAWSTADGSGAWDAVWTALDSGVVPTTVAGNGGKGTRKPARRFSASRM